MSWIKMKLSDCCVSIADGDHQPPPKSDKGIPFVTISNINDTNQFDFSNTMFVPEEYYNNLDNKKKAKVGDVLYSVVGSFGIPVRIRDDKKFVFQRHIAILRPNDKILSGFLYYTMLSKDFYDKADAAAIGAAQRTISLTSLRNMEIAVPEIEKQTRIVEMLSAYDDLIENNQKQIKLLEEAAQRLYKEWFVDMRFPGYESTPIVDGLPEGWKISSFREIAFFKRGKTITKDQTVLGKIPVVAGGLEPAYFHNQANTSPPVITVSASGANAGYTRMYYRDVWASDCSYVDSESTYNVYFAYSFLKSRKNDIDLLQKGSAQPHVYAKDLNALEIMVPTETVLQLFDSAVKPYFLKIKELESQIELSKQARDYFLPKLMSGDLEV